MNLFHEVSFCLRKGDCNLCYMARGKIASSPDLAGSRVAVVEGTVGRVSTGQGL